MSTTLEAYRQIRGAVPSRMLRWNLYGAGIENFGRDGSPELVETPTYGPNELLVRHDACGLCYSDTKVIALGAEHPRLVGRDLAVDPVTLGHEVCCTVVGVGENLRNRFHFGERYVVQADVFYHGKSMAYGYVFRGGLSEYGVIPHEMIDGDEGCYLLPLKPTTGYVEAALIEPWACVVAAYGIRHRETPKPGGRFLLVLGEGWDSIRLTGLWEGDIRPKEVVLMPWQGASIENIHSALSTRGIQGRIVSWQEVVGENANAYLETLGSFDDIVLAGCLAPEVVEKVCALPSDGGVVVFALEKPIARKIELDVGRIHYNRRFYVGAPDLDISKAYKEERTAELKAGGAAWFVGAGGPMGQMHVQRAIQLPQPPALVVVTDRHDERLDSLKARFGELALQRGVELIARNVRSLTEEEQAEWLLHLTNGRGFDDIVSLVANPNSLEFAANLLARGGWFNIFAGVPRGTMIGVDANRIAKEGCRFIGSSGSSLADMRETLNRVERGELNTNASLAAIGGMEAARDGLLAVREGRFPGKTLIFPHIHTLPLTALTDLRETLPSVYALLENGKFWTKAAEEELFRLKLSV